MRVRAVLLLTAGAVVGALAYRAQIDNLGPGTTPTRASAQVAVAWSFLLAGLIAWWRRPGNHLGPLMVAVCFASLARQFQYSHDALTFTIFFLIGELSYALFAHAALAYPSGRVVDRLERGFLKVAYATVLVFPLAILLVYDGSHRLRFFDPRPHESLLVVHGDGDLARSLQDVYALFAYGGLATVFIALLVRKLVVATPRARRILAPLLVAALAAALRAFFEGMITIASPPPVLVAKNLFWWQTAAVTAVPLFLLAGLLRSRLARAAVGDLVVRLERTPAADIRDELARTLGDPTLEVAFWVPNRREYVDARGNAVELPEDGPRRAVTTLDHEGEPLAALVHDPTLRDEPQLVEAVGAAARLALENARLNAEVHAQLAKVKESRARIVAAGDEQRRRIERDIHDGAQQRLVALGMELSSAQQQLSGRVDVEVDRLLGSVVAELKLAVGDLRELARGIHPAILTEGGLKAALDSLATRSSVPVKVEAKLDRRFPPDVEATAYFVAAEALTNVAKHAQATRATVTAEHVDGVLRVEVVDDGVGGARADGGTGLRGLADRVEAQGGRLRVESPREGGTRIVGDVPCES